MGLKNNYASRHSVSWAGDGDQSIDTTSIMGDMHVLLVDDQKVIRTILRGMLRDMGVTRVAEAGDGAEALEFLQRPECLDVDLVVCDLHMEGMDGLDFCNRMRRDDRLREKHIPILMLTSESSKMLLDTVRQVGAADIAAKPISPAEFRQRIENLLGLQTG